MSESSPQNLPREPIAPLAGSAASGRFSHDHPEGDGAAPAPLSEQERHRRLWLQHALQTPQPARLHLPPK